MFCLTRRSQPAARSSKLAASRISLVRIAAILHPYDPDSFLEPFRAPGVNLFRGTDVESSDLPDAVIVFGGDGSIHRLLPSLALSQCPVLIVPTGSGNDFAHSLALHTIDDALRAWKVFLADPAATRTIDLGLLEFGEPLPAADAALNPDRVPDAPHTWTFADTDGRIQRPDRKLNTAIMQAQLRHVTEAEALSRRTYYCCIAGIGLDAEANAIGNRMSRWFRRHGGYSWAALRALFRHQPRNVTATMADGSRFSGPSLLCAFGNANSYGGGLRMLPNARLDDQLLDVAFIDAVSTAYVLRKFRTIYSGRHLALPEVHYAQTSQVSIATDRPMPIYADGEFVGHTPVQAKIVPKALTVIAPK